MALFTGADEGLDSITDQAGATTNGDAWVAPLLRRVRVVHSADLFWKERPLLEHETYGGRKTRAENRQQPAKKCLNDGIMQIGRHES